MQKLQNTQAPAGEGEMCYQLLFNQKLCYISLSYLFSRKVQPWKWNIVWLIVYTSAKRAKFHALKLFMREMLYSKEWLSAHCLGLQEKRLTGHLVEIILEIQSNNKKS